MTVEHRRMNLNGVDVFYREAGARDAPAILLPHGYPCSSYQYRNLMPALADRWHLVAPDFPGFGYSGTPEQFSYDFDGYAELLDEFTSALKLRRYALYLHDYGSQIGLRHAIRRPERIAALVIQNGDIYEDVLGHGGPHGRPEAEPALVPEIPGLSTRAPAGDAHPLGTAGWLHAGEIRPRLSS